MLARKSTEELPTAWARSIPPKFHSYDHALFDPTGAGVLSLSYSIAQLGWIGGMLVLLAFAAITWYTTRLLADVCLVNGVRQRSYMGEWLFCGTW